jgi:phosphatidylserine decarboxylase
LCGFLRVKTLHRLTYVSSPGCYISIGASQLCDDDSNDAFFRRPCAHQTRVEQADQVVAADLNGHLAMAGVAEVGAIEPSHPIEQV